MYNFNFFIVCPPFTSSLFAHHSGNGDSKEEWYLGVRERGREDSCHVEASEVIGFNKYSMTNAVIGYGEDSQHNLVYGREIQNSVWK